MSENDDADESKRRKSTHECTECGCEIRPKIVAGIGAPADFSRYCPDCGGSTDFELKNGVSIVNGQYVTDENYD